MERSCFWHPYRQGPSRSYVSSRSSLILSIQYNDGIPEDSRFAHHKDFFKQRIEGLKTPEGQAQLEKVRQLTKLAKDELDTGIIQLSLAFIAALPNTGTIILGCTSPKQLEEQLRTLDIIPRITPEVVEKVEAILQNKPKAP